MLDNKPEEQGSAKQAAAVLQTSAICEITINQQQIKYDILEVQLEQFIDCHHTLRVKIRETGTATAAADFADSSGYIGFLGQAISLTIKPQGGQVDAGRSLSFGGLVTGINLENSIDGLNEVTVVARSQTIVMDGARKNAYFLDQTASDIIGSIARRHSVTVGQIDSTKTKFKFSVQKRETDYEYIMRLAGENGLFAHFDGKEFRATKANSSTVEELVWRESLGSFTLGLGTRVTELNSDVYNYEQDKTYSQKTSQLPSQTALSGLSKSSLDASKKIFKDPSYSGVRKRVEDQQTLAEVIQHRGEDLLNGMISCVGTSIIPSVTVGHAVRIKGMGVCDGPYWVTRAKHVLADGGKYHNEFTCAPLDVAFPRAGDPRPRVASLQRAVVTDNVDPSKLGRIKVQFPWNSAADTLWVRMAVPYAGSNRGWYTVPEIGDEVLVGYEEDNPDMAIVLGALYNKTQTPPSSGPDTDNNFKLFMSRSGHQIIFDDTSNDEKISIITKDAKNQIVMKLGGGQPTLTIQSDGDISIKGKNIQIESDMDCSIKAGGTAKIEGAMLDEKAQGQLQIQGAMVTVKGTPIQLN